tara:strand:- start:6690 stop:7292 length:603 start_codon:yes stop_codon:yes gene_type:complete
MRALKSLQNLIEEFCRLPGIGEKSAQRLAYHVLKNRETYPDSLSQALIEVKEQIKTCPKCFSFTEKSESCEICANPHRSARQICVVEEPFDIAQIESFGKYHGQYHVLGGSLSPLQGIGPDQLKIKELLERLKAENDVEEVILALDADLEGDTTALYIAKLLEETKIRVSRLAHGIPFGTDIDYIDQRTLGRAFENRIDV